ncbi:MAG: RluA family pseudouridine synthase [Candidatus Magasanikbacteria bacterium CG10_big_fil_rev_8_21_14_0_10_47_10]|uniref:Pseudouridine synthase n=1 Tax=Candidatus Magasanikbacteria bacterium CG10_big_fil_rev_8_21_14_0_10_47_10 TaxID=1974652 RepID=A0A2H0TR80_9BACT|nr:MAG: RluA family pseudouridine synthase [Candidatus Magasanikbacteria bacterium CG10_big_fil_rev_8_21_14_0_10_47_10]
MNQEQQTFIVSEPGQRLDIFLAGKISQSRSQAKKHIDRGGVMVNGKEPKKAGDMLSPGDKVSLAMTDFSRGILSQAEAVQLPDIHVVLETDEYLVLDKPAGLLVHPTQAGETRTVAAWLLNAYPDIAGVGGHPDRPGIVHRLDKDASGVLVIAKTQRMFDHLKKQFQDRKIQKLYSVLVYGVVAAEHDAIDFPIDRGKDGKMVARPRQGEVTLKNITRLQSGKIALTEFWVENRFARFTLLRVQIHSGRTHQIRVHMYAYGNPVVGDSLYVKPKLKKKGDRDLGRLFLHASSLTFADSAGKAVTAEAPLPAELRMYVETLS